MPTPAASKWLTELVLVVVDVAATRFRQIVWAESAQILLAAPTGPLLLWPGLLSTPRISAPKRERIVMWPWNWLVVVFWYSPIDGPITTSPPSPPGSPGRTLAPIVAVATVPSPWGLPMSWSGGW